MKHITIIGGGITGLSAAFYLQKKIKEEQLPFQISLVESSNRLGGKIRTEKKDGFTIERGPDSFLIRKQSAERLVQNLGLGDKLVKNGTGKSYVLAGESLHEMPKGSFMGIPVQMKPFLSSSLFSMVGKARVGLDFIEPKSTLQGDQSLGQFLRRRIGDEVVENLIEPLLSGIYANDLDNLSLMATFPNFYHLEQEHGSLIKGLWNTLPNQKQSGGKKESKFFSVKGGLHSVIDAIEAELGKNIVQKNTPVDRVEKKGEQYDVHLKDGTIQTSDLVLITTPYPVMKELLNEYDFIRDLRDVKATSVANVALAFDESAIKEDIDGSGFVVSRNSDYRITACTWTHKKWPKTTAPPGKALLRCYVGRPGDESVIDLSDEELEALVLNDLNKIMRIEGKPLFSVVTRWRHAMPQYSVGHQELTEKLETGLSHHLPGVFVAGSPYRGIGIPDCIDQGEAAVEKIVNFILH